MDGPTFLDENSTNVTATTNDNHTALSNTPDTPTTTTTSYDETTNSFNTTDNVPETTDNSTIVTGSYVSGMCSGNSTMNETTNSTGKRVK